MYPISQSRRSFLRKATAATTVTGIALQSAQSVAAAPQELEVEGHGPTGGEYAIIVNDPSGSGGNDLESTDSVKHPSGETQFLGEVGPNDTDTFHFDGQVTRAVMSNEVSFTVHNPDGFNIDGDIEVVSSPNEFYGIKVTGSMSGTSDLESTDTVSGDECNGEGNALNETDTYSAQGTIETVNVGTPSDGDYLDITHHI